MRKFRTNYRKSSEKTTEISELKTIEPFDKKSFLKQVKLFKTPQLHDNSPTDSLND